MEHEDEWASDARIVGQDWRTHADWAMAMALILRDPDKTTSREDNDTVYYSRVYSLVRKNTNQVVATRNSRVVVARKSKNIITAFPTNKECPRNP
jgi:hypothetical protein